MSVLSGKNIILGVTAGIAAYKTTFLVRILIKKGAKVKVVMTPASKDFVTPLTLSTLSHLGCSGRMFVVKGPTSDHIIFAHLLYTIIATRI